MQPFEAENALRWGNRQARRKPEPAARTACSCDQPILQPLSSQEGIPPCPVSAPHRERPFAVSNACAEASRKNGAKSRGPKTEAGKQRPAQNALKHGLRAQKYVVLPQEDAAEFEALEFRSYEGANVGLALIRDGNGTRGVETLLRYRGAAMAELTRALRTLKAPPLIPMT